VWRLGCGVGTGQLYGDFEKLVAKERRMRRRRRRRRIFCRNLARKMAEMDFSDG